MLKALAHPAVYGQCNPLVIGDRRILDRAMIELNIDPLHIDDAGGPATAVFQPGTATLIDLNSQSSRLSLGSHSPASGKAAVEYLCACDMAMAGEVDAIVTAPLNKAAMFAAGFRIAGHTELLTDAPARERSMLLIGPNLRVVHVSTHVAL
ncbi:MAG: 4-hydroxythreonine-4-phosphate dehydrogenase PdxA [Thermomicrobiales bacterium]